MNTNGIRVNGIRVNGVDVNGIRVNGLNVDSLSISGLSQPDSLSLMAYMAACAAPSGASFTMKIWLA